MGGWGAGLQGEIGRQRMEVPLALPWQAALCSDLSPIPGGEHWELGQRKRKGKNKKGEDMDWELGKVWKFGGD